MTETASPAPETPRPERKRRGAWRKAGRVAAVVFAVLLVLVAIAWLNRRAAARELLIGWLDRKGIEADLEIERIELDRLVARVRVGDPANPQVSVDRVEVDYALWSNGALGLSPSRVRLVRPVVRARLQDGKLSFGPLDPLIQEFSSRPPPPDSRGPVIQVEQGKVRLDSDWGRAEINADARIDDGKLMRLRAILPPTALASGGVSARGLTGTADLTTVGDRLTGRIGLAAEQASLAGFAGEAARGEVRLDVPYPDLKTRRGDGRARIEATLTGDRLAGAGTEAREAVLTATFDGQVAGWLETFSLSGRGDTRLRAATLSSENAARGQALDLRLDAQRAVIRRADDHLTWRVDGAAGLAAGSIQAPGLGLSARGLQATARRFVLGGRDQAFELSGPLALTAARLGWNDMTLDGARVAADLDLVSDGALRVEAGGSLAASRGAWPLFGAVGREDVPELAEMKRALSAFAVDIPAWRLAAGGGGTRVTLARPATLKPANGGVLTLIPARTPIFEAESGQAGGGALSLTATRGQGLPEARFDIPAWRLIDGGFTATLDGQAALDFGLARGLRVTTRGELASRDGRLTYVAQGCSPVSVALLELDENDVTDVRLDLCPVSQPLVVSTNGRWRAEAAFRDLSASAPFLIARAVNAEGRFVATGDAKGLGLDATVAQATVDNDAEPRRFNPVSASGRVRLEDERWSGGFDLSRNGTPLGAMTLRHDGRAGVGGLTIDAPALTFAEGGLQPADLSPLAEDIIGSPAVGEVSFTGRIDWREDAEGYSGGRLTIPGLDFVSPAGPVKGLRGTVDFISLAPLITAPDQTLTVDTVETFAPLTQVSAGFSLNEAALTLSGASLSAAGGTVRIEPISIPLDQTQPFSGVLVLDRIQLGQLVTGAGFGDKVQLDALVSGRLPFTADPKTGWRIIGGTLHAIQPGRVSIQREALTGLDAGGGGEAIPPGTVEDLAYQAMENLAFDVLSAEVNSLDGGRLGVLFHIKGRHDPPQRQELRIGLADFISRRFLERQLPLPSDTGIDLTLDTTLNVNQLISDLMAYNRARAGETEPTP